MLRFPRPYFLLAALAIATIIALYASLGWPRPPALWNRLDIAGQAGIALMAGVGLLIVLGSRPPGRATALLACGLGGLMLGAVAACMNDLFIAPVGEHWNEVVASGITLAGVAALTIGLLYWRQEKFLLTEHLQQRERLLRDPRSCDQLTQVADADCLREQLSLEHERGLGMSSMLMLDIDDFHLINRDFGQREGDRVLQSITHLLLLNLRPTDLLCRYAGDRFAVLLPGTRADTAQAMGHHLRRAVASLRHHAQHSGQPIMPTLRYVFREVDTDPRQLLKEMNRSLERRMPEGAAEEHYAGAQSMRA